MALKLGLDLDPTRGSWAEQRRIVEAADRLGYDSLYTWDHLYGYDDPGCPIVEGWTTIAAWGALTSRPTVGLLVGANTFRNPGVVAKSAITVDHVTGGRCVLGLGSGWRPREHAEHGIPFGAGFGERLEWLEEAVGLIRGPPARRDGEPPGGRYGFRDASHRPLPVRGPGRLPILIGGGGEKRTLRIVARHADIWHHRGPVEYLRAKLDVLHGHCRVVGRAPAEIELAFDPVVVIRDDPAEARRVHQRALVHHGQNPDRDPSEAFFGSPEVVAERWAPYIDLGFRHLIANLLTPYDLETVERLPTVRRLLDE